MSARMARWSNTMTETEWLASVDPQKMLRFLKDRVSDHKGRVFASACLSRVSDPGYGCRAVLEADHAAYKACRGRHMLQVAWLARWAASQAATRAGWWWSARRRARGAENRAQAGLL